MLQFSIIVELYAPFCYNEFKVKEGINMKKSYFTFAVLALLVCIGCAKDPRQDVIGHWVSADQRDSISFDDRDTVVVNEKYIGDYSIYDEGKMAINVDTATFDDVYDISMSASYVVKDGILQITDNENYEVYLFYSENQISKLKNEEYQLIYRGEPSVDYMALPISYPEDDWDLHLDGTDLEGVADRDMLIRESVIAFEIAEEEIMPLYFNSMIDGENLFTYSCKCASWIWDKVGYEVEVKCSIKPEMNCTYVIDPNSRTIYVLDENGVVSVWSGTLKGNSILEYI